MNVRDLIALINVVFSKIFIKAIFLLAILMSLASLLPWTKGIYDRMFPLPELRITEPGSSLDTQVGNEWICERVAIVENRGNGTANQVYVTASVPGGRIDKYEVFADQPYTIHPITDISRGYLVIGLDRLPPGARIKVYLWASQVECLQSNRIFAAVYDGGSAPSTTQLSSEEQVRGFLDMIVANLEESSTRIIDKVMGSKGIRIPQVPSYFAISAISLAVLAWLFLDSIPAALVHGGLASGIWWLAAPPIVILPLFLILCTLPFFFLVKVRGSPYSAESRAMFALSALFLVFALIDMLCGVRTDEFVIPCVVRDVTGIVTAGYLATMLSLVLL
jgi:hypothetical protein